MTTKSVFVIRSSDKERKSRGGFQWPEAGPVEAADWSPKPECGYGLHGLLWGIGNWSLCRCTDPSAVWQVVEVAGDTIVDLEGKVKFPRGVVVYSGSLAGAMSLITAKHFEHLKTAASSGDRSPAACLGIGGRAKAGPTGSIIVTYLDAANRPRHAVGYPGENGIEPHVWYEVANGQLVKSANQNDPTT